MKFKNMVILLVIVIVVGLNGESSYCVESAHSESYFQSVDKSLYVLEKLASRYKPYNRINISDDYKRITLTSGKDHNNSVNISWETSIDKKFGKVRISLYNNEEYFNYFHDEYNANERLVSSKYKSETYSHKAFSLRLESLESDSEYIYSVGDGVNWSKPRVFKTKDYNNEDRLVFLGDIQGYKSSHFNTVKSNLDAALKQLDGAELTLLAGDIVNHSNRLEEWKQVDSWLEGFWSNNIVIATPGNHDTNYGSDIYESTFLGPLNGISELPNTNYWIETDYALIAVWNSENRDSIDRQSQWLREISKNSNKPFKMVLMHRSAYPIQYNEGYIRNLSEVFEEAKIDLVLSGHDHIYSRTTMSDDKKTKIGDGVTYVVGGSSSGSKYYNEKKILGGRYWRDIVFDNNVPVFSTIIIRNDRIKFKAYSNLKGEIMVIDEFEIE